MSHSVRVAPDAHSRLVYKFSEVELSTLICLFQPECEKIHMVTSHVKPLSRAKGRQFTCAEDLSMAAG